MSLASTSLPKPKNWQDFESCIRELFACVLDDPNTQQNGRTGQKQNGVDVFGHRNRKIDQLVGVQCKKKFENKVTEKDLRSEVDKAKTFKPELSEFILVTTAPRDQEIQKYARILTQKLAKTTHPFLVSVWGWEDVEEHVSKHDKAWKAFDPTWSPFAETSQEKIILEIEKVAQSIEMISKGTIAPSSIPSDDTLNESDENTPLHGQITAFQHLIDEGHVQAALSQLEELKNSAWVKATGSERYRILVGIASAKLKLGAHEEAGSLLLDAYNECPGHKNAPRNKATGLLLKRNYKEAADLARKILAEDQSNAGVAGTLIQALIDDDACDNPLSEVPVTLHKTEDVLIAYVHFLRCRDNIAWVSEAKAASKKHPECRMLKLFAAEAMLDELICTDCDVIAGGILKNIDLQGIDDVAEILVTQASLAIRNGLALSPSTAHNAALALRFTNDHSKAKEILEASIKQNPLDENLRVQRAIIALSENDPAAVLALFPDTPKDLEAIGIFVEALDEKGRQSEALELIDGIDESVFPEHVQAVFLSVRLRAYLKQGEKQVAIDAITQRVEAKPASLSLRAMQVNTYYAAGDNEGASNAFEDALALVTDQTSLLSRMLLSFEARKLGRDDAICSLLKNRVATNRESEGLRILIAASINSGSWVTAREILDEVPPSLRESDWFLRANAILAINAGNAMADKKITLYLGKFPNDIKMILHRLGIWQRAGRDSDIRRSLKHLELVKLVGPPEQRIQLAAIIIHYGEALQGLEYGYSVLMDNWDVPQAHLAYQALVFLDEDFGAVMPSATVVAENTVVCLLVEGGERRRYRIEKNKHAYFENERLSPASDLAVLLIGKEPGVKFNLQERIGSKPVEIDWVKSKYLDAFHRSLDEFNERFPRARGLQKFTFDPAAADPFEDMRAVTKACAEVDEGILGKYQSQGLPLVFVAALVGKDPLEVWGGLPSVGMQCQVCRGTYPERRAAIQTIRRHSQVGCVLDAITLSVVRRLGMEKAVIAVCGKIHTTQSVVDLFARRAMESKQNIGKVKGFMAWREGQMVFEEYSDETLQRVAAECDKEIVWIKKVASIAPAMPKKDFTPEMLRIINTVGKVACDPAVAAEGNDLLLLSEDYGFRVWAGATFEAATTWLQPVLIIAKEDGHITSDEYCEAVNTLALAGHNYISLDPNCLIHQARKDNFEITHELTSMLEMVGGPSADMSANSGVMSSFIDAVIDECSDDLKIKRIASEVFCFFTKGSREKLVTLVMLIIRRVERRKFFMQEHALGWLVGHSIGMPYHKNILQAHDKIMSRYFV